MNNLSLTTILKNCHFPPLSHQLLIDHQLVVRLWYSLPNLKNHGSSGMLEFIKLNTTFDIILFKWCVMMLAIAISFCEDRVA